MKITVDVPETDVKHTVAEILQNLPECCICLRCTNWNYATNEFVILEDPDDDGKWDVEHKLTLDKALEAFKKLACKWVLEGRYTYPDVMDAGCWDAPMIDSLVQVAVLGEEVYG